MQRGPRVAEVSLITGVALLDAPESIVGSDDAAFPGDIAHAHRGTQAEALGVDAHAGEIDKFVPRYG